MKLLINSSTLALWHDIIHDAESSCAIHLQDELEAYLVYLMIRFTNQPDIANHIMATDFLKSMNLHPAEKTVGLQQVGDKCLIFSGLFPTLAEKRLVKISYYVKLGQASYSAISKHDTDIYSLLAKRFVPLMDVIQSLRQHKESFPTLLPLQAYDLWNETGSQRALSILKMYSNATPIGSFTEVSEFPIKKT